MQKKKIRYFIAYLFMVLFLTLIIISFFSYSLNKVLFFNSFLIALIVSVCFAYIWYVKNKNIFETFLCFLIFALISINMSALAPVFIDRSLSVFTYFYAVENGIIPNNIYNEKYFKEFSLRRIEDANNMLFLKCNDNECIPTIKSKLAYYILMPIGKITNSMKNYNEFKNVLDKN